MSNSSTVLKHPQLRRLIAASVPADMADWLDYVAVVALLAYQWQQGPWVLALFAVALGAPYILIGPIAGALVDRTDLRRVLVLANFGRALSTAALILAPNAAIVLGLIFVRSCIDSAFTPARQAAIQALAHKDQLETVNATVHGINQGAKVIGPALGGLLLAIVSPQWIFGINACLSLLATVIVWGVITPKKPTSEQRSSALFGEVLEGFRQVQGNPRVLLAMVFMALGLFAIFLYDTFLALLAIDFGFAASVYGVAIAAAGAGGVLGAVLAANIKFGGAHLRVMAAGAAASGIFALSLGLFSIYEFALPVAAFLGGFLTIGICMAFVQVPYRALLQHETPPDKMARVVATGEAGSVTAMLSAPFLGGWLVLQFGIGMPFVVGGGLLLVAGLVVILMPHNQSSAGG